MKILYNVAVMDLDIDIPKTWTKTSFSQFKTRQNKTSSNWWFYPASSTTKTGRHDIAEILLKEALNTKNHHHHEY
jgi:hypothetical protein